MLKKYQGGPLETSEKRQAVIDNIESMAKNGDLDGLKSIINSRANSNVKNDAFKMVASNWSKVKKNWADLKQSGVKLEGDDYTAFKKMNDDLAAQAKDTSQELDEYRAVTAMAAQAYSEARMEKEKKAGTFKEYNKQTLGSLKSVGYLETMSPAWHAARAEGLGGSDIGPIMGMGGQYANSNYNRVLRAKLGENKDSDNIKPALTTVFGRGHAWEDTIRYDYMDRNPDKNVIFTKDSWENSEEPWKKANFDGLIADDNGNINGILEIKTGSGAGWGDPSEGASSVPDYYVAQSVWYAKNAGVKNITFATTFNDNDYREYSFTLDDPVAKDISDRMDDQVNDFWNNKLPEAKRILAEGGDPYLPEKKWK